MNSYRDTWAEISLGAVHHNTAFIKSLIPAACRFMAVVKADGYGHGAVHVAQTAIRAGADYLGVAIVDEALALRRSGIDHPILVLGYTPPRSVEIAVLNRIAVTICSDEGLSAVVAAAEKNNRRAVIHIKVDTGMGRLGVRTAEEVAALVGKAAGCPLVEVEGLFTHFADADEESGSYARQQFGLFCSMVEQLNRLDIHFPVKHCCNTSAALLYPDYRLDMVRIGIGLYGLAPVDRERLASFGWPLQQAVQVKTRISLLRTLDAGESVGYGRTFETARQAIIAVIPVGYADGYPRALSNRGFVGIRGRRVPIVGRICMDQTMIDVTELADVRIGEEVVLFGGSGHDAIPIDEAAGWADTIHYELVCAIGSRVPRVYRQPGEDGRIDDFPAVQPIESITG